MIELLGFIGLLVTVLVALPATLLAFIRIFAHPIQEIISLWMELIDTVLDIIESIKTQFRKE